jgi:hypothetical protein
MQHSLQPHPATPAGAVREVSVDVARSPHDHLDFKFRLTGDLATLRFPEPRSQVRSDGIWKHSCFEVFIGHAGASDYWEFNFSPSGAWAAYHFTGYREGMAPMLKGAPPAIAQHIGHETFQLDVQLDLSWLARSSAGIGLRLGLAAVVEDKERVPSYWALKHPAEKPDFHHADSFVVVLD